MELSFVLSAVKRRFWMVLVGGLLGAIPGIFLEPGSGDVYRSTSLLLLKEPTQGANSFVSPDRDRYVINQLSVLKSASIVESVAKDVGLESSVIGASVTITEKPGTDIVEIATQLSDPDLANETTRTYVETYLSTLDKQALDTREEQRLDELITEGRTSLAEIDQEIETQMRPYLSRTNAIPPASAVASNEVSQRQLLLQELTALILSREKLLSESRLRVNTRMIQQATVPNPDFPISTGSPLLLPAGIIAGLSLGLVAALAWARFSTKVLDVDMISQALGAPVVSELPHYRSLSRSPLAAFQSLPRSAVPVIDQLCVRAEAKSQLEQALTVVVVGTQRAAGATTLSLALAERFASSGASVVLVDADTRDPRITTMFNAKANGGIPAVIANDGALIDQHGQSVFTRTMDPGVSVLGLGTGRASSFRRETVASVLEAARRKADVVIIDGGPVLDLASTIQLTEMSDAVVLSVPLQRQKSDELSDLSRQFGVIRDKLLPVVTSPAKANSKVAVANSVVQRVEPTGIPQPQPQPQSIRVDTTASGSQDFIATQRAEPNDPHNAQRGVADSITKTTEISLEQVKETSDGA